MWYSAPGDEANMMEERDTLPSHFMIKIESFSLLKQHGIDKYETKLFKAGGYTWKLIIQVNEKDDEGKGYVSVSLAMADTTALPENWEVNAFFSISVLHHVSGKYHYTLGRTRRFHAMKCEWGIPQFISHEDFTKGYIINDACVFGADVFISNNAALVECLSVKKVSSLADSYKRVYKIENFSKLKDTWRSEVFTAGGHKWKVHLEPNGRSSENERYLSIFIYNADIVPFASSERLYAQITFTIKDQTSANKHITYTVYKWFETSGSSWGLPWFMELESLKDPKRGFIVNDSCLLIAEFNVQAISM